VLSEGWKRGGGKGESRSGHPATCLSLLVPFMLFPCRDLLKCFVTITMPLFLAVRESGLTLPPSCGCSALTPHVMVLDYGAFLVPLYAVGHGILSRFETHLMTEHWRMP
jgi:hypothetical protein